MVCNDLTDKNSENLHRCIAMILSGMTGDEIEKEV